MKTFLPLLALLFIFSFNSFSQSDIQRVEIEAKVKSDNYSIVPAGDNGVLVFSESKEKVKTVDGKSRVWSITKYDVNFKEEWTDELYVEKKADLYRFIYEDDFLYLLFATIEDKNNDVHVFKLNVKDGDFRDIRGTVPYMQLNDMTVANNKLLIAGNTYPTPGQVKSRALYTMLCCYIPSIFGSLRFPVAPLLYVADFDQNRLKLVTVQTDFRGSMRDVQYVPEEDNYYSIMIEQSKKKIFSTKLSSYDGNVTKKKDVIVKSSNNNILVNGKMMPLADNQKLLIGTFSKPKSEKKGKKDKWGKIESVEGLFFTRFTEGKQEFIKYYDFADLASYKDESSASHMLLVHNIIQREDEYIIVAEAYYPQYHTESYTDANGNSHTTVVFDGYRYTHAIAAGFDAKGNLLWDHAFKIMEILTFNLTERVKVIMSDDDIVLAYAYGGYIMTKILRGEDIIDGKRSTELDTEFSSDKVKANYDSEVQYWYDNYFLASGYQKIKSDKKETGDRKRHVFYFNKVGYK